MLGISCETKNFKDNKYPELSADRKAEPKWIVNYFEEEFEKESLLENIQKNTPFTRVNQTINVPNLKETKLRFYTEPDSTWHKENRQTDFESTNAFAIQQITDQLKTTQNWENPLNDRPLSYFIAHEAVHSLQRNYDQFLIFKAPIEIIEGYAEFIAKAETTDLNYLKDCFKSNSPTMNPQNGLYDRYNLYISRLFKEKGFDFQKVLKEQPDLEQTLNELIED